MRTYRVSNVERFRQYEEDEDGDTAQLIADITGWGEPSQAMLAGTAFHKVLELAQAGEVFERAQMGDFVFVFKEDIVVPVTPIRELRASKVYTVDGEPIGISGQVDAIEGLRIEDHKTTGNFSPERYLEGYQWRLYLDIFEANRFLWNVFEIKEVDDPGDPSGKFRAGPNPLDMHPFDQGAVDTDPVIVDPFALAPFCYEVLRQHTLEQYRYPTMTDDIHALVSRFARFVREHIEQPATVAA